MATAVAVEQRLYFQTDSLVNPDWYYVSLGGGFPEYFKNTEADLRKELTKRGYKNIEMRYHSATWP
jgi:hypothetical protein